MSEKKETPKIVVRSAEKAMASVQALIKRATK